MSQYPFPNYGGKEVYVVIGAIRRRERYNNHMLLQSVTTYRDVCACLNFFRAGAFKAQILHDQFSVKIIFCDVKWYQFLRKRNIEKAKRYLIEHKPVPVCIVFEVRQK